MEKKGGEGGVEAETSAAARVAETAALIMKLHVAVSRSTDFLSNCEKRARSSTQYNGCCEDHNGCQLEIGSGYKHQRGYLNYELLVNPLEFCR